MPLKRPLSKEDQEALDRMFACQKRQVQTAGQHWQRWALEVVWGENFSRASMALR